MTELSKTEQELIDIIQTAWCDISATPDDRFGDFLKRAAMRIKQAGWTSPAEIKEIDEHIQEQVNNDPNYMLRVFIESGEWQEFVGVER